MATQTSIEIIFSNARYTSGVNLRMCNYSFKTWITNIINDIALIKLTQTVKLNNGVQMACLPDSEEMDIAGKRTLFVGL